MADEIAKRGLADVRVVTAIGEPGAILDAWTGARLATVVDAAMGENAKPGRIRHWTPGDDAESSIVSFTCFWAAADLCAGRSSRTATRETRRFDRGHRPMPVSALGSHRPWPPPSQRSLRRWWRSSVGVCATRLDTRRQAAIRLRVPPRRWVVLEVQGRRTGRRTQFQVGNPTSMARGAWCRCVASNGIGARACEPQICFWGFSARTWRRPGSPPAVDSVAGAVSGSREVRREW